MYDNDIRVLGGVDLILSHLSSSQIYRAIILPLKTIRRAIYTATNPNLARHERAPSGSKWVLTADALIFSRLLPKRRSLSIWLLVIMSSVVPLSPVPFFSPLLSYLTSLNDQGFQSSPVKPVEGAVLTHLDLMLEVWVDGVNNGPGSQHYSWMYVPPSLLSFLPYADNSLNRTARDLSDQFHIIAYLLQ